MAQNGPKWPILGPWGFGPKWPKTLEFRAFENPGFLKISDLANFGHFGPLARPWPGRASGRPFQAQYEKKGHFWPKMAQNGPKRGPKMAQNGRFWAILGTPILSPFQLTLSWSADLGPGEAKSGQKGVPNMAQIRPLGPVPGASLIMNPKYDT